MNTMLLLHSVFVIVVFVHGGIMGTCSENDFLMTFKPATWSGDGNLESIFKIIWNEETLWAVSKVHSFPQLESNAAMFLINNPGRDPAYQSSGLLSHKAGLSTRETSFDGLLLGQPVLIHVSKYKRCSSFSFFTCKLPNGMSLNVTLESDQSEQVSSHSGNIIVWDSTFRTHLLDGHLSSSCSSTGVFYDCDGEVTFRIPYLQLYWRGRGKMSSTPDGRHFDFVLERTAPSSVPVRMVLAFTSTANTSLELKVDVSQAMRSLLSFSVDYSWEAIAQRLDWRVASEVFDWLFYGQSDMQIGATGRNVHGKCEGNYFHQPSPTPILYKLDYKEGSTEGPLIDLAHSISSPLYSFFGSMTVKEEHERPDVVTEVIQKIRSPLSDGFYLDLRQIFHQSGFWNWETVVMRSGLVDMHVDGKWDKTPLDHYRKLFQFRSHNEDVLPSVNVALEYSDRRTLHHSFQFPLLAQTYQLPIELSDQLLPSAVQLLYRNEFKANSSRMIARLHLHHQCEGPFTVQIATTEEISSTLGALMAQFRKVFGWTDDAQHPINVMLKHVSGRSSVSQSARDLHSWLITVPELSYVLKNIAGSCLA